MLLPVVLNLASLASTLGTEQFMAYFDEMREIENLMRAGRPLLKQCDEGKEGICEQSAQQVASTSVIPAPSVSVAPETEIKSRFQALKFRKAVKARSRPKRPSRQLYSFNRSAADRVSTTSSSQKPVKRRSTQSKDELIPRKRRKQAAQRCPVCNILIHEDDASVTSTTCCSLLVHEACFDATDLCPDCEA